MSHLRKYGKLPFLGMEIIRSSTRLDKKVYRKPIDTGLLLHYNSHVDIKYIVQTFSVKNNAKPQTGNFFIRNVNA